MNIHFEYSFFNVIFYVNNITKIFGRKMFVIGLLDRDNRF